MPRFSPHCVGLALCTLLVAGSGCDRRGAEWTTPPGGCTLAGPPAPFTLKLRELDGPQQPIRSRTFRVTVRGGWRAAQHYDCLDSPDMEVDTGKGCRSALGDSRGSAHVSIMRYKHGIEIEVEYYHRYSDELRGNKGPKRVVVTVRAGDERVYKRVFRPTYKRIEVNGPGCGIDEYSEPYKDRFSLRGDE